MIEEQPGKVVCQRRLALGREVMSGLNPRINDERQVRPIFQSLRDLLQPFLFRLGVNGRRCTPRPFECPIVDEPFNDVFGVFRASSFELSYVSVGHVWMFPLALLNDAGSVRVPCTILPDPSLRAARPMTRTDHENIAANTCFGNDQSVYDALGRLAKSPLKNARVSAINLGAQRFEE
jgi:hypothetical protein